jgi:acyl transferase domain-containing protein
MFGARGHEAMLMDPQQCLLLHCFHAAIQSDKQVSCMTQL